MNPTEQKERRTAVQKLETEFERTKEDLTLLLERSLAAQHDAHVRFVQQHEQVIAQQAESLLRTIDDRTEFSRRGFWGRLRWLFLGT